MSKRAIKTPIKIRNFASKEKKTPEEINRALIVPIYKKKGERKLQRNIFCYALKRRIEFTIEPQLRDEQGGFR